MYKRLNLLYGQCEKKRVSDYKNLATHCKIIVKYYAFFRGCFEEPEIFHNTCPTTMLRQDDIFLSLAYDFQLRAIRKWISAFCDANSEVYFKTVLSKEHLTKCEAEFYRIFNGEKCFNSVLSEIVNLVSKVDKKPNDYEAILYDFNFKQYFLVAKSTIDVCGSRPIDIKSYFNKNLPKILLDK